MMKKQRARCNAFIARTVWSVLYLQSVSCWLLFVLDLPNFRGFNNRRYPATTIIVTIAAEATTKTVGKGATTK